MGAPGRALRVFQAGPHSLLRFFYGWTYTFKSAPLFTFWPIEGANQPERLSMQGVIQRLLKV
ncbi:hypothetical protein D4A39_09975 [Alcanivorax profundi]|uniref:Uncharacterized protein n=1 Tax=Alcanivorax profundi TaxID=2338368 RepID=A0A418XW57_9GAMM|nr:hypothetical protein D4A39_09975 [Alcanivorax profundi]